MDGGTTFTLCFLIFWGFIAVVSTSMMRHTTRRKAIEGAALLPLKEENIRPAPRTRKRTPKFVDADPRLATGFNELVAGATRSETVSGKVLKGA